MALPWKIPGCVVPPGKREGHKAPPLHPSDYWIRVPWLLLPLASLRMRQAAAT